MLDRFYDNSILPGTKILLGSDICPKMFYDNSILPGTKIGKLCVVSEYGFYDNSILPGTKIYCGMRENNMGFTITQFFQVLK